MRSLVLFCLLGCTLVALAQNCGCASDEPCCSQWGYCGTTAEYCDKAQGCQQGCWGSGSSSGNNNNYGSMEDGDRPGADLAGQPQSASNANDCQKRCYDNQACGSWAFDTCGSNCWLKSGQVAKRAANCRKSGSIPNRNGGGSTSGGNSGNGGTSGGGGSCSYKNEQKWTGWGFYDQFDFWTSGDPTHGHVKFVDRGTAQNTGLISVNGNGQVYMGVDHNNNAPNGRPAIRLTSKMSFTTGMVILDLDHMPGSVCGSWPAFWTVGGDWPNKGEIDIIEGVNKGDTNQMTLHTNSGCRMSGQSQTGRTVQANCDVAATGNSGCGVQNTKGNSYGDNFNRAGGGAYVMERANDGIKVWFFPKGQYPSDLLSGNPNPCNWGTPDSHFPLGNNCPSFHFGPQNIVFDITFCGDWAGAVFGQQCGGDCNNFVSYNPGAFKESYWLINSLRVLSR